MLVLFDLDNTLGNRSEAFAGWAREFVVDHQLPSDAFDWIIAEDNDGYSDKGDLFAGVVRRFGLTSTPDDLLGSFRQRVVELTKPLPGAIDCLTECRRRGWTTAIVTNGTSTQQHAKIDHLGLRPLVDAVIVSGDLDIKKPDRRIFDAASAATGQPLSGGWMIGDSIEKDIVAAQQLSMSTAWLHRDRSWPVALKPPTAIVDDLSQLVNAIGSS